MKIAFESDDGIKAFSAKRNWQDLSPADLYCEKCYREFPEKKKLIKKKKKKSRDLKVPKGIKNT